jgi:hypothetical protein
MNSTAFRRAAFGAAILVLSVLLSGVRMFAQVPAAARPQTAAPVEPARQVVVDERRAEDTRDRLHQVLDQYPPSLREVLRLDPSLLTSETYLAPYPNLAAFLAQHPEVAHNPSFFVGEVNYNRWNPPDPRHQAIELWEHVMGVMAAIFVFLVVTSVLAWLVRTLIDYRRWLRLSKIQTEAHSKLLDRFTSNEDLLAYIQSASGRKFLESAPIPLDLGPRSISAPLGRILWSVQAGLVLALAGLGLQYVSTGIIQDVAQPIHAMGVLAMMFGVGFILSAVVAWVLSRRLGLLEPPAPGSAARTTAPDQSS